MMFRKKLQANTCSFWKLILRTECGNRASLQAFMAHLPTAFPVGFKRSHFASIISLYLEFKTAPGKPPALSTFGSENTKSPETKHNLYHFTGRKITWLALDFMFFGIGNIFSSLSLVSVCYLYLSTNQLRF